jgi:hypothetical protein
MAGSRTDRSFASNNAMNISSSINLAPPKVEGGWAPIFYKGWVKASSHPAAPIVEKKRLIISPKFECPILDFTNIDPTTPTYSSIGGTVAKGMWHQYGQIPATSSANVTRGQGIRLEIHGPKSAAGSKRWDSGNEVAGEFSLAQLLQFSPDQMSSNNSYLGRLGAYGPYTKNSIKGERKTFSEAIVAIPFKFMTGDTSLYKINPAAVHGGIFPPQDWVPGGYSPGTPENQPEVKGARPLFLDDNGKVKDVFDPVGGDLIEKGVDPVIYDLLKKMHKYVLPPHLDFLRDPSIAPFAMYMWEFEIKLTTQDLQNVWQNIEPTFARKTVRAASDVISHIMPTTQDQLQAGWEKRLMGPEHMFFNQVYDGKHTRWAVFKVKKRSRNNYTNVIGRDHGNFNYVREDLDQNIKDFAFSYNWPHDFYSLIELAKVNVNTTFTKRAHEIEISPKGGKWNEE